jgi:thiol-disulfide isomerase/thioredoxin
MKKSLVMLGLVLSVCCSYAQTTVTKMNIGELDEYITKSEKPLIVNFWATFCKPCVDEIPYFLSHISDRYEGEVDLVLVSLDPQDYYPRKLTAFAGSRKFTAPIIWLNESNADVFCPRINVKWSGAISATLMINNKTGVKKFYDRQLTPLQFEKEVKQLVNG